MHQTKKLNKVNIYLLEVNSKLNSLLEVIYKMKIDTLPNDIIETIVKCVDITSFPYFKCCCKSINAIAINELYKSKLSVSFEEKLLKIIDIVSEYHLGFSDKKVKSYIVKIILKGLFLKYKKDPHTVKRDISKMMKHVIKKQNCTGEEAAMAWWRHVADKSLNDKDRDIIQEMEDYIFLKRYTVEFDSYECNGKSKYYTEMKIKFDDEDYPTLCFCILNKDNKKLLNEEGIKEIKKLIPGIRYEHGTIMFKISKKNISGFSKNAVNIMGTGICGLRTMKTVDIRCYFNFMQTLNEDVFDREVNKCIDSVTYCERIYNVLEKLS